MNKFVKKEENKAFFASFSSFYSVFRFVLLSSETCSTHNSRIVSESCGNNTSSLLAVSCVLLLVNYLVQGSGEVFALVAHTAADTEYLGLEYIYHICNAYGKITDIRISDFFTVFVTLFHSIEGSAGTYSTVLALLVEEL